MAKKGFVLLVLAVALVGEIFSQSSGTMGFIDNYSVQGFQERAAIMFNDDIIYRRGLIKTTKLANTLVSDIRQGLRNYSLDIGDVFLYVGGGNPSFDFIILLRITDPQTLQFSYYAYYTMVH
jgi:hypothetical protein